ncbi:hypothetical protein AD21_4997, partial [Escherichia coli 6-319-05_S4_C2]
GEMGVFLGVPVKLQKKKPPPVAGEHVADKLRFMLPDVA